MFIKLLFKHIFPFSLSRMNFTNARDFMVANKRPFMHLMILVDEVTLHYKYVAAVENHNSKIIQNINFPDSGFDLMTPYHADSLIGASRMVSHKVNKVDLGVRCSAVLHDSAGNSFNTGYYLYPRSSISKSSIRLANSVGIIDAGYRGPICAMVDVVYGDECFLTAYEKMFQICAPTLVPIIAEVVCDLGEMTSRGEGGFGSTNNV